LAGDPELHGRDPDLSPCRAALRADTGGHHRLVADVPRPRGPRRTVARRARRRAARRTGGARRAAADPRLRARRRRSGADVATAAHDRAGARPRAPSRRSRARGAGSDAAPHRAVPGAGPRRRLRPMRRRLRRFAAVGAIVTALDVAVLLVLRLGVGLPVIVADACSVAVAATASYLLHRTITFAGPVSGDPYLRWVDRTGLFVL